MSDRLCLMSVHAARREAHRRCETQRPCAGSFGFPSSEGLRRMRAMAKPRGRAKSAPPLRLTLGIDEAGRGPSVGPMVIAAVVLCSRSAAALTRKGLCDSKTYGAGDDAHATR